MADCLNNEQQINSNLSESNVDALTSNLDGASSVTSEMSGESSISSTMYSADSTTSNLGAEEPLDSKLDLPTTYTYYGSDGDNITVTVDNKGFIISASVKQIMYDSFSLFPKIGSERLIYVDRQTKSLYAYNSRNQSYFKLVADTKPIYSGISGSEFSMNPNGVAVVKVENFPYENFSSIPNGTILEVQFLNPYVDAINEYPLYLQINDMDSLRVLVTEGKSDTYYNPVTMGGWKANDVLRFVKGRSWMLTMISGRIVNGIVTEAQYSQKAGKDSSGNTFETYYAKETDVSTIRNSYLKSATVSGDTLNITDQSGNVVSFQGGSGGGSTVADAELSETSTNAVQNKVVTEALKKKLNISDIDSALSTTSENPVQNKVVAENLNNFSITPSSNYINLAGEGTYTAPANGYYQVRGQINSKYNYASIDIFNNNNGMCSRSYAYSQNAGTEPGIRVFLPAKKGDSVTISFNENRSELGGGYARFYYAKEIE